METQLRTKITDAKDIVESSGAMDTDFFSL